MRDIKIVLPKTTYIAGENVEGYALVQCDKGFECNKIHITFSGYIKTRISRGSGKHKTVHRQTIRLFEVMGILHEGGFINSGDTRFDFSFGLPENLPPSYDSYHGDIYYQLDAKIEVSWAIDPKDSVRINMVFPYYKEPGKSARVAYENDGAHPPLEVEVAETSLCIGEEIPVRVRVAREVKIRKVRFELVHHEHTRARSFTNHSQNSLIEAEVGSDEIPYDSWFAVNIKIPEHTPPSFDAQIIKSFVKLKVTLDIPWRFDKSVEIPLICGHCIRRIEEPHNDPFNI